MKSQVMLLVRRHSIACLTNPFVLAVFLCLAAMPKMVTAQWVLTSGAGGSQVYALTVSGSNTFAGTYGSGVFVSTNNGANWTSANSGLSNTNVYALAANGNNVFTGTWGGGAFLTTNNGASWTGVNTGLLFGLIYAMASSGGNVFAGTASGGIYLTTNNGTSWTTSLGNTTIYALAVSGNNVFAATYGSVSLTTNMGTNWTAVSSGLPSNKSVYAVAASGSNVFAGTSGSGVFMSTNNGTNWTAASSGLTSQNIYALLVIGSNVFAGTDGGVFRTTNNGVNWTGVSTGLTNQFVLSLAVSGSYILAGTAGSTGVFRRPLSDFGIASTPSETPKSLPASFTLSQNYPNPFNPSTVISYQLSVSSKITLTVYDVLGREVATLVNEKKAAGNYDVTFDASHLASGVYFYKLQAEATTGAGNFVQTKKMLLVK